MLAFAAAAAVALSVELVAADGPVLAVELESLVAPLDCETAWVNAWSKAVNKLLPLLLPRLVAPADSE